MVPELVKLTKDTVEFAECQMFIKNGYAHFVKLHAVLSSHSDTFP